MKIYVSEQYMDEKETDYTKEQIKENCVIEFLCLLTDKPLFSIKMIVNKIRSFFIKDL